MRKLSLLFVCSITVFFTSLQAEAAHSIVRLRPEAAARFRPGDVVVHARQRVLLFILDGGRAVRYPVAVPKPGKEWTGVAHVVNMMRWPAWSPPDVVRRDHPELPDVIPGGAPNNPCGAAAIQLSHGQAAIHGTAPKMRKSIGTAASYGCIRMLNEDVEDLYERVGIGTTVYMLP